MLPQFLKPSAKKCSSASGYLSVSYWQKKINNVIQTNLNINFIFFPFTLCIVELPMDHLFHLQNRRTKF